MGSKVDSDIYRVKKHEFIIGIDPGVKTGLACYVDGELWMDVVTISRAMFVLVAIKAEHEIKKVIVEDARKRKWFGKRTSGKEQGAGSIKRDCQIWDDFLTEYNLPFEMKHPIKGGTKVSKKLFEQYWKGYKITGKNNEHTRDAAMLIRSEVK